MQKRRTQANKDYCTGRIHSDFADSLVKPSASKRPRRKTGDTD